MHQNAVEKQEKKIPLPHSTELEEANNPCRNTSGLSEPLASLGSHHKPLCVADALDYLDSPGWSLGKGMQGHFKPTRSSSSTDSPAAVSPPCVSAFLPGLWQFQH